MTPNEFARLCQDRGTTPAAAVEFEEVREALATGNRKLIAQAVKKFF